MRPDPFSLDDTIVALATPPGRSALALLRVSGKDSGPILRRVAPGLPENLTPRAPRLAAILGAEGAPVDRGLVTFFPGPGSATGEDVAELSVHGGLAVVRGVLAALVSAGARPARPGEFTRRAFLSGRLDLVEAEAVRELIEARTEAAVAASARRLDGSLSRRLAGVREELSAAAAELAATIDFAEDVGEAVSPRTPGRIARAREELERLAGSGERGRLLAEGARVVLLGAPNAGKSTIFNALVGTERAIVTEVPGTTRDTLDATLDIGGVPVELVDTAGLRPTEDPVERMGVARARAAAEGADAVLYVFDAAAGWSPEDSGAVESLNGARLLVIANKIDTVRPAGAGRTSGPVPSPRPALPLCGIAADAGEKLRAELAALLDGGPPGEAYSEMLASARQRDAVVRAQAAAAQAFAALERGESPEYPAAQVHEALDALADLVGETTHEDVLERIFASFCIGK